MKPRLENAQKAALMTAVAAALLGVGVSGAHRDSRTQVALNTAMTTAQLASLRSLKPAPLAPTDSEPSCPRHA